MALFAAGSIVAALDTTIPVFFGHVVTLLLRPAALSHWAQVWPQFLGMGLELLVARPTAMLLSWSRSEKTYTILAAAKPASRQRFRMSQPGISHTRTPL